jgi:hypothetical protein
VRASVSAGVVVPARWAWRMAAMVSFIRTAQIDGML